MKHNCPISHSLVADTASESALVEDVEMFPPSSVTSSPPLWTSSPPASITSPLRTVGKIRTKGVVVLGSSVNTIRSFLLIATGSAEMDGGTRGSHINQARVFSVS